MKKTAFLFPGQGSQSVGMGKEFFDNFNSAKEVFKKADAALGFEISGMCFNGTEEDLKATENAQPAILTASIAVLSVVKDIIKPSVVAGHSLGEYSALVAAGALDFSDAVKVVRKRGEFMKAASGGTMAAILALMRDEVTEICKVASTGINDLVAPANFNSPGQIVVSGTKEGVDKVCKLTKEKGGKAIPLAVSGPFHSSLMAPAQRSLSGVLKDIKINNPSMDFIANVTADYARDGNTVKDLLIKQVTSAVLWEDTVNRMIKDGVEVFVEVGPGKVLSGLVKKIKRDAVIYNVENLATLEVFKQGINK